MQESLDHSALDITLFVACYNEESRIIGTLETIKQALGKLPHIRYEAIIVDDGSKDKTCEIVEKYLRENPALPMRLHRNSRNLGLARSFVDTAFMGKGRYYRLVCGDNVEPVETMMQLLSLMGKADMILPYYPHLPGKSIIRKLVSRFWTFLVDSASGHQIKYYNGCGIYLRYNVMRWAPYNYGFGFQADLITILLDEGATCREIAVSGSHYVKEDGNSPLNIRNFLSTGYTLFRLFVRRIRNMIYG